MTNELAHELRVNLSTALMPIIAAVLPKVEKIDPALVEAYTDAIITNAEFLSAAIVVLEKQEAISLSEHGIFHSNF